MNTLDRLFQKKLMQSAKNVALSKLIKIVDEKICNTGNRLSKTQKRRLRKLLEGEMPSKIYFRFNSPIPSAIENTISITNEDRQEVETTYKSCFKGLQKVTDKISTIQSKRVLKSLKRAWPEAANHHNRLIKGFERRLKIRWGKPLDLLAMLITIAYEVGSDLSEHPEEEVARKQQALHALVRLHARSCQVASEILILLKSGFADGAMARWRTLHEIAVTAFFIEKHGEDSARRYLAYDVIESYKGAVQYQQHCKMLGCKPFTVDELEMLRVQKENALTEFGSSFGKNYGWAAQGLGISEPTFAQIEKDVGLEHFRPYYKFASQNVHADPKGVLYKLGLMDEVALLAGPSNIGFTDPGHNTALSLTKVTSTLLMLQPTLDHTIMMKVMIALSDEIGAAFLKIQHELEGMVTD